MGCDRPSLEVGHACELTSDCESPLVCRLDRCRVQCRASRDCAVGQACVVAANGNVCQVRQDECTLTSECPQGLVCRGQRCTNTCETSRDCALGSACVADDDGVVGCLDTAGQPCERNSDCPVPEHICGTDRRCREQCITNRDCRDGLLCNVASTPRVCSDPDDGGVFVLDGGPDGSIVIGPDSGLDAGVDAAMPTDASTPDAGPGLPSTRLFAGGTFHNCASRVSGPIYCWGFNERGQLGNDMTGTLQPPVAVGGLADANALAAGAAHTCASTPAGVHCWGANDDGQLGDGTTTESTTPVPVRTLTGPVATLVAGREHTCAVDGSTLWCWGRNVEGQLGLGHTMPQSSPAPVPALGAVADIGAAGSHSCVAYLSGEVQCWGVNASGQLGDGTFANSTSPVSVAGIVDATAVSLGSNHSCALLATGELRCWGSDSSGQLGNGSTSGNQNTPTTVVWSSMAAPRVLAAGQSHNCVVASDGTVHCWGTNGSLQLGQGLVVFGAEAPLEATMLLRPADSVVAGDLHTCVRIDSLDEFACWGDNISGQLNGTTTPTESAAPVDVALP